MQQKLSELCTATHLDNFIVVPRTIESSTNKTFLPLNSSNIGLSFRLTDALLSPCSGIINVLQHIYSLQIQKYLFVKNFCHLDATRDGTSGIGMTTSISSSAMCFLIFSASFVPIAVVLDKH